MNQHPGGALGLSDALFVERNIGLPLESTLGVPRGTTVPPQHDSAFAHEEAFRLDWIVTDSGNASSGQSFHSRSMA